MSGPRERPILFSSAMVRAILDGRKTQTRRVMAPQPEHLQRHEWRGKLVYEGEHRLWCWRGHTFENLWDEYIREPERLELSCMAPHIVGDRLWLKETIRRVNGRAVFAADGAPTVIDTWPWKRDVLTAIHTPRGASRITLEIAEVRPQLLHEIDESDARSEGCSGIPDVVDVTPREEFQRLWDSINGKPRPMLDDDGEPVLDDNGRRIMVASRSWASNPWVWAITFRRLS